MKKIFLAVISFAVLFTSCSTSTDEVSGLDSISSTASQEVTSYIANNYPGTTIVSSSKASSSVTTVLNTGEELVFSTSGAFKAYSNNASNGLLADSLLVSTDSTHNDSISNGHRGGKGHGNKGGKTGKGGGDKHQKDSTSTGKGHKRHFDNEIAVDSLSTEINAYISTNYSGYTVIHAEIDTICEGVVTEVLVALTNEQPLKLVFDSASAYLFKAQRIEYSAVPTLVSAAVTANYSTYTAMKRCELYTYPDGALKYNVFMKSTSARKQVTFNADGTVSCEK